MLISVWKHYQMSPIEDCIVCKISYHYFRDLHRVIAFFFYINSSPVVTLSLMSFVSLEFTDGYLKHINITCVSVIYVKKVIVAFIEAYAKCI